MEGKESWNKYLWVMKVLKEPSLAPCIFATSDFNTASFLISLVGK